MYYRIISSMVKSVISSLLTGLYAVYKASDIVTTLNTGVYRVYNGDDVNDTSGNAQHGTNVGGVTFTTGKVGNAFTFNGSNYINLPSASLNSLTGDFSVSWWMNLAGVGADAQFPVGAFYYDGVNLYGWDCYIQASNLNFQIFNGTSNLTINTLTTGVGPYYGTWAFFTLVRKGSTSSKIYINGALVASNSNTTNPVHHASSTATIGARRFDSTVQYYMSNGGKIDAVTIYNKELTASEITALHNGASGMEYPFSSAVTINSANDSLGTYNGTAQGGLTYSAGKSGNAFVFNGTNSYVSLPSTSLEFTADFSVSLWLYIPTAIADDQTVIGCLRQPSGWRGWHIEVYDNRIYFEFATASAKRGNAFISATNIGAWKHVVATFKNGVGGKLYIDADLKFTTLETNPIAYDTTKTPTIGCMSYGAGLTWFLKNNTKVDEINTWTKELTPTEITELYNSGTGKFYPTF
jgi:hypothetical protein